MATMTARRLTASTCLPDGIYVTDNSLTRIDDYNRLYNDVLYIYAGNLYKGVIDCSGNPNYSAGTVGEYWRVSVAGLIGGASGVEVEIGDEIICIATSIGGTEAAVGSQFMIVQKNLQACTITELRAGVSTAEYLCPSVFSTQINGASPATAMSSATLLNLAGGTTEQIKLTSTAAQKALTITSTAQTVANIVDIGATITSNTTNVIGMTISSTAGLSGAEVITGSNITITDLAAHADTSWLIGYSSTLTGIADSQADKVGFRAIIGGERNTVDTDNGFLAQFTGTMNNATTDTYGVRVIATAAAGWIHTLGTFHGVYVSNTLASAVSANCYQYGVHVIMPVAYQGTANHTAAFHATGNGNTADILIGDGFRLEMTEPASIAMNIISDTTLLDNRLQILVSSRDLKGAIAADRVITNYGFDLSQEVDNSTAGDYDITNNAGIMRLTSTHIVSPTGFPGTPKTQHDTYSGTTLYIHNHATTTAVADALLTNTSRALDIVYDVTIGAASTIDLASLDIARIDVNIPIGLTSLGAYNLTFLNIDGSDYLGNDVNTTLRGINLDLSGVKTVAAMRGIDITMETSSANLSQGIFVNAKNSGNNTGVYVYALNGGNFSSAAQGWEVDKYVMMTATPAGNKTNSSYAARINMANTNAVTDGSDNLCTANGLNIIYSTTNTATTVPTADTLTGKALQITIAASVANDGAGANSFIDTMSAGGIYIPYSLTQVGNGVLQVDSVNIYDVVFTTTGAPDYKNNAIVNFYNVTATDTNTPTTAGVARITGYNVDLSALKATDANLTLYGAYIHMPNVGASTQYGVHIEDNVRTINLVTGTQALYASDSVNIVALSNGTVGATLTSNVVNTANANALVYAEKTLTGAITADRISSGDAATIRVDTTNTSAGDFDATTQGNVLVIGLTHTANETTGAKTNPDICSARGMYMPIYAITTNAIDKLDMSSTAILVDYNVVETLGTLTLSAHGIIGIEYNTSGTPDYAAGNYNFFSILATDASTPTYGATTYLSGYKADLSAVKVSDVNLTLYGVYIVMPGTYGNSTEYAAYFAGDSRTLALLTDTSHIYSAETIITDMPVTTPGAGFNTAGGVLYVPHGKKGVGGMLLEEIFIDLGTAAVTAIDTDNDVIGEAAGGAAYIGQITAALNGTVTAIEVICMEVPAGGNTDINIYSADENTWVYNDDITTSGTEVLLVDAAGAWTLGMVKASANLPTANQYIYLTNGAAAGAGAYTAGKFIIRIYGV